MIGSVECAHYCPAEYTRRSVFDLSASVWYQSTRVVGVVAAAAVAIPIFSPTIRAGVVDVAGTHSGIVGVGQSDLFASSTRAHMNHTVHLIPFGSYFARILSPQNCIDIENILLYE